MSIEYEGVIRRLKEGQKLNSFDFSKKVTKPESIIVAQESVKVSADELKKSVDSFNNFLSNVPKRRRHKIRKAVGRMNSVEVNVKEPIEEFDARIDLLGRIEEIASQYHGLMQSAQSLSEAGDVIAGMEMAYRAEVMVDNEILEVLLNETAKEILSYKDIENSLNKFGLTMSDALKRKV